MTLPFLTLPGLAAVDGLAHGFFTRAGGVSPAPYHSLNLATATGDDPAHVRENLRRVRTALDLERLVLVHQVHGAVVAVADGHLPAEERQTLAQADALITARPGLGLVIKLADCLGVALVHPPSRSVGAVHAGWRGLVGGVIPATVRAMAWTFGLDPAELRAGLSPTLGPCCAEFRNYRSEFPPELWAYADQRGHFDLVALARDQLVRAGLARDRIEALGLCTKCRGDLFFSHRGQGPTTGRMGLVVGFRD